MGHDALDRYRFAHRGRQHPLGSLRSQVGSAASSGGVVFSDPTKPSLLGRRMSILSFYCLPATHSLLTTNVI